MIEQNNKVLNAQEEWFSFINKLSVLSESNLLRKKEQNQKTQHNVKLKNLKIYPNN